MAWLSMSAFEPALPEHCVPQTDFLLRFSSTFHTCIPTPLALLSNTLGTLSIIAWLFAQLPQIYKNFSLRSTSGLSIYFLVEWCLGDISNLLGALFTHQASWQVAIGSYYVFVDLCLVGQWFWYEKLKHGHAVFRVWKRGGEHRENGSSDSGGVRMVVNGVPVQEQEHGVVEHESDDVQGQDNRKPQTRPRIIFRTPTFEEKNEEDASTSRLGTPSGSSISRVGRASPMPSPSPRTVLLIACLVAMAQASPISTYVRNAHPTDTSAPTRLETAGTILSWMSTFLYLGSRLPQLFKNWRRKSVHGLSAHLFIAAFCGNVFYSSALLTNPCAWNDFGPYGGGGWVGEAGSDRVEWTLAALPFFLGASGVLGLDASVGVQFLLYGESREKLVILEAEEGRKWHLRRVSGWLRGWVPSISEGKPPERQGLLERGSQRGEGYGGVSAVRRLDDVES